MEFTRVERSPAAPPAEGDIAVRAAPPVPRLAAGNVAARVAPVLMLLAMAGMLVFYFRSGSVTGRNPMFLLFPAMMVLSMIGSTLLGSRGARRAGEIDGDRREYLVYLDAIGECAGRTAAEQHRWLHQNHPSPDALWTLAGTERMWQRRRREDDFTEIRVGLGARPLCTTLVPSPAAGDGATDPLTTSALDWLLRTVACVPEVPVTVVVNEFRRIGLGGDDPRGVVRAMVCQLASWHGPDEVKIAAVTGSAEWDWLKWLPHHYRSGVIGGPPLRFAEIGSVSAIAGCHLVVLADAVAVAGFEDTAGVTLLVVGEPGSASTLPSCPALDTLTATQAQTCARRLARYRLVGSTDVTRRQRDWVPRWPDRPRRHRLRVPIGTDDTGAPVELDLKEPAEHGMGPHGLCIGATGSGNTDQYL